MSPMMVSAPQAAAEAAAKRGVFLDSRTASDVALAVLAAHDNKITARHRAHFREWAEEPIRESILKHLRRDLFLKVGDEGVLPIELPVQRLHYLVDAFGFGGEREVTAEQVEAGHPWEVVEVVLSMRTRPPVPAAASTPTEAWVYR